MGKLRILVAEDENLVALDICRSLERHGFSVEGPCATAEAAIQLTQERRPDVVVMDIMLRGPLDGIEAAARIRDTTGIPVLFLTAHADQQTVNRARIVEPDGYLIKPFDDAQLYAALQMVLYRCQSVERDELRPGPAQIEERTKPVELDKTEFLNQQDFFASIDRFELSRFADVCSTVVLKPGELLVADRDEGGLPAFIVQSGRIAMVEPSSEGKELICEIVPPGDLFGLISAMERRHEPLQARATRETTLLIIPKKTFLLLLESHSQLALRFTEYISERLRAAQSLARAIAYDDVFTRVTLTLRALLPRFGKPAANPDSFSVDFSRQELASLTGTTVETVVRVLKSMERAGTVRLGQRNRIEISNVQALNDLARAIPKEAKEDIV